MPQSASAWLHPWAVPVLSQPSPSIPPSPRGFVPRDALGGHLRDNEGRWEWGGNAAPGLDTPNPPSGHPEQGQGELEFCSVLGREEEEEEEDAQARLAPGACAELALAGRRTLRIYRLTRSAGASQ